MPSLIERLTSHRTIGRVPREQLEWLAGVGHEFTIEPGEILTPSTGPVKGLYVVLDGHLLIRVDRGAGPRIVMEWRAGDVTGLLPYSRIKGPPGDVVAEERSTIFAVDAADLPRLTRECHELTAVLVHVMVDRARVFKSSELLDEKMISLGRLAAGLAHELNNPASAVARSAKTLRAELATLGEVTKRFFALNLSDAQVSAVAEWRQKHSALDVATPPLELADRQDAIDAWLAEHNVTAINLEPLAASGVQAADLDALSSLIGSDKVGPVLEYTATGQTVQQLAAEIDMAATRIHSLVAAVKGFTYVNQETTPLPIAIERGISDTVTVLKHKARSHAVEVSVHVAPNLPTGEGYGGELNQVWANLLDNAIDAAPKGHVRIEADRAGDGVVVRVIDDGPGIPPEIAHRIFDPFFTTKDVGQGTGLGLDIARRIVQRHRGAIDMSTSAKGTEFLSDVARVAGTVIRSVLMAKPVILVVDDDHEVLSAVERDLRHHYRQTYRIVAAQSSKQGLEATQELQRRGTPIALFLIDQRMPDMTGTEFLREARKLYPGAKRTLLTAYADSEAAIAAINDVGLDHYLMKPWDPPEQRLYPVLDDLLADWSSRARTSFEGVRVIGSRLSPRSYATRDFLSRNQIPYQWIDIDQDAAMRELALSANGGDLSRLPVVLLIDGTALTTPTNSELATKTGLQTAPARPFYDLAIVGAGPAGLACAVYGASEGLKVILIEQNAPGGQAGTSSLIENYLGFPGGLTGADLAQRATMQAKRFGTELLVGHSVVGVKRVDPYKVVQLSNGAEVACHALLLSTGMTVRELDVPGIKPLLGAGVYYGAALSEAAMYRGQQVFVLGGANSAGQGALFFARYAEHVTLIVRKPSLLPTMSHYLVDKIKSADNISVMGDTEVTAVHGNGRLEKLDIRNVATGEARTLDGQALFIFIGVAPHTEAFTSLVATDERGFILTGADAKAAAKGWNLDRDPLMFETTVPGVFAAGDTRANANRRIAAAVGEGSAAIFSVHQYLNSV